MKQEKGGDQFHNNEAEYLYDLYNACNGVLHNGLLDIRKLDELSQEEAEVLNIAMLREVWNHMASGCERCKGIVDTLNSARKQMSKRIADPDQKSAPPVDDSHINPLSEQTKRSKK